MADFSKASGNSREGVEMIAVVRPNRVAYKKDEDGKPTSEPAVHFVDVMVNNSALKKADVQAGKGEAHPNLLNQKVEYEDKETGEKKTGYNHEIRLSSGQLETIEKAGGSRTLTKEDGTKYIPFKADVMPVTEKVKDEEGKVVKTEDGKDKVRVVGYMPNTKTVTESELGNLTEKRLDKHFDNTKAINEVQAAQAQANKNAALSATAAKSAPEAEVQSSGLEK